MDWRADARDERNGRAGPACSACRVVRNTRRHKVPAKVDHAQVQRSLRNAWSTEILLAMPGQWTTEDEFIRLANSWGVIQTYYVVYHATQAARGATRPQPEGRSRPLGVRLTLRADRSSWSAALRNEYL